MLLGKDEKLLSIASVLIFLGILSFEVFLFGHGIWVFLGPIAPGAFVMDIEECWSLLGKCCSLCKDRMLERFTQ